jgi:hypothetical protein
VGRAAISQAFGIAARLGWMNFQMNFHMKFQMNFHTNLHTNLQTNLGDDELDREAGS